MGMSCSDSPWLIIVVVFALSFEGSALENTNPQYLQTATGYLNPEPSVTARNHRTYEEVRQAANDEIFMATDELTLGIAPTPTTKFSSEYFYSQTPDHPQASMMVDFVTSSSTSAKELYEDVFSTSYSSAKIENEFTTVTPIPSITAASIAVDSYPSVGNEIIEDVGFTSPTTNEVISSNYIDSTTKEKVFNNLSRNNVSSTGILESCNTSSTPGLEKGLKECNEEGFFCLGDITSCEGRCGQHSFIYCACDEYCNLYDRCCPDYKIVCQDTLKLIKSASSATINGRAECWSSITPYLLISGCSEGFSHELVWGCQNDDVWPISINRFHFKNVNCLLCNGFRLTDGVMWNRSIHYRHNRSVDPFVFEDVRLTSVKKNSIFQWAPPKRPHLYMCSLNIIDDCPGGTDAELRKLCLIHRSMVRVTESGNLTLFRNKFCAECHLKSEKTCRTAHIDDFGDVAQGSGRFASLISMTIHRNRTKAILRADSPFMWAEMTCDIRDKDLTQLDCQAVSCRRGASVVNKSCTLENNIYCLHFSLELLVKNGRIPSCENNSCIEDLFNASARRIMDMTNREYGIVRLKQYASRKKQSGFYINMELHKDKTSLNGPANGMRLLMAYQSQLNNLYMRKGLEGTEVTMRLGGGCGKPTYIYKTFTIENYPVHAASGGLYGNISAFMISILISGLLNVCNAFCNENKKHTFKV